MKDTEIQLPARAEHLPPAVTRIADPLISIVVPCYNETEAVELFHETICDVLKGQRLELVFVNDGSKDDTIGKLIALSRRDDRVVVVNLSRNFGKEVAMTAGIEQASGDVVIPMDVDLQDPPDLIPTFLEKWREGYDVVYGVRVDRSSDTAGKRMTSGIFYRLFNRLAQTEIPANAGDYRLMDRVAVDAICQLTERNRFMKGLFAWIGFPSIGVEYVRPERAAGETKFNFWRLWNFALDGVVSFSSLPLRIWTYAGGVIALVSVLYACLIVIRTLVYGIDVPGYASTMAAVLFLGGVQLISLGVIGEYLSRLFVETKGRPIYLLQGVYRKGAKTQEGTRDGDAQSS